jgi:hypothetical protein
MNGRHQRAEGKKRRQRCRKPDARGGAVVALSASFEHEGDTIPAEGTLTLHMGDKTVGQGRIKTQPGKFSIAGEGLNIGKDSGEPVTTDYPGQAPWPFTGGTIHRVAVDVSGQPFVDLAAEVRMAYMRD